MATPKSTAAATRLLQEYADLGARVALVEEDRTRAIAAANQRADVAAEPMLKRQGDIVAVLASWWPNAAAELAPGRKSTELGGCMIGTKASRATLAHNFDSDDKAVEALLGSRFAKHTTKVRYSLDRTATKKLLEVGGKTADSIAALGFRIEPGSDQFFLERVQQAATIGS